MSSSVDRAALREASLKVGIRITVVCAVMVVVVIVVAAIYLLNLAQHTAVPEPDGSGSPRVYVETSDIIKAMIAAGLAGIVLAGAVGWLSARSAIRPLANALALQRRFVQDASHELKTPLTILDARVQLAQRRTAAGAEIGDILQKIRADTAAMSGTIEELLLAATDAPADPGSEPVDVAGIAGAASADLQQLARERGISLAFSREGSPRVRLQANSLRRAVVALLDNALTHTPPGGRVTVTVIDQGAEAVVTVADTGTGITGVDKARVFDRFARTAAPPATGQRSFGIGLALVREIVINAGGQVQITETGPEGTTMTMTLPATNVGLVRGKPRL